MHYEGALDRVGARRCACFASFYLFAFSAPVVALPGLTWS